MKLLNADFRMSYKKYGTVPVNNIVASVQYLPEKDKQGDGYWFDISTEKELLDVYNDLNDRIQADSKKGCLYYTGWSIN